MHEGGLLQPITHSNAIFGVMVSRSCLDRRTLRLVPGADGKGRHLRRLVQAAEGPGLGLQELLPVVRRQRPAPRLPACATLHCWASPSLLNCSTFQAPCFHSAPRSHLTDFIEIIVVFTQLCLQ